MTIIYIEEKNKNRQGALMAFKKTVETVTTERRSYVFPVCLSHNLYF